MSVKINIYCVISSVLLILQLTTINATEHCGDKKRHLIMDSCEALSKLHKQQLSPWSSTTQAPIVKRENDMDILYSLEAIPDEDVYDYPKGHKMYFVWRNDFPEGTKLVMTKQNAKRLRQYDPEYKIRLIPHFYENRDGVLERVSKRHVRNAVEHHHHKRDIHNKIAVCCENDVRCVAMLCFARN